MEMVGGTSDIFQAIFLHFDASQLMFKIAKTQPATHWSAELDRWELIAVCQAVDGPMTLRR